MRFSKNFAGASGFHVPNLAARSIRPSRASDGGSFAVATETLETLNQRRIIHRSQSWLVTFLCEHVPSSNRCDRSPLPNYPRGTNGIRDDSNSRPDGIRSRRAVRHSSSGEVACRTPRSPRRTVGRSAVSRRGRSCRPGSRRAAVPRQDLLGRQCAGADRGARSSSATRLRAERTLSAGRYAPRRRMSGTSH